MSEQRRNSMMLWNHTRILQIKWRNSKPDLPAKDSRCPTICSLPFRGLYGSLSVSPLVHWLVVVSYSSFSEVFFYTSMRRWTFPGFPKLCFRIPRYALLLKDYKKCIPSSVRDSYALKVNIWIRLSHWGIWHRIKELILTAAPWKWAGSSYWCGHQYCWGGNWKSWSLSLSLYGIGEIVENSPTHRSSQGFRGKIWCGSSEACINVSWA